MEIRQSTQPLAYSIRKELENFVCAYNTCLRETVRAMSEITLLRNAHPIYRADFAYRLRDAKLITPEECKEFVARQEPFMRHK